MDLAGWEKVATNLGAAVWIADDISDLERDLRANRWSYVWLLLARAQGPNVSGQECMLIRAFDLGRELIVTGKIADAAATAVAGFTESMRWLEENAECDLEFFRQGFLAWLKSWVLA